MTDMTDIPDITVNKSWIRYWIYRDILNGYYWISLRILRIRRIFYGCPSAIVDIFGYDERIYQDILNGYVQILLRILLI